MPFLLDTCAISELAAQVPDQRAVDRILSLPRDELFLSVIVVGELHAGIEQMPPSKRKDFLRSWFTDHVLTLYADRTHGIDAPTAIRWGALTSETRKRGLPMQISDALIAATALVHDLTVVTRNDADFAPSGVKVFNPWK